MKFFTTLMSVLCSVAYSFSQDTLSPSKKHEFLTNGNIILKPSEIISNFRPAERPWLADRQYEWAEDDPVPFESAYNLNAFDFFNLTAIYDTDLKKEMFRQTDDYSRLLDSLKEIKAGFLNSVYYTQRLHFDKENILGDYDIKKRGFFVEIGPVRPDYCNRTFLPKVIGDVEFKQLQIHKRYDSLFQGDKSYSQYIFIPMDAAPALEVENNRNDIGFLLVFDINGIYTALFNDKDFAEQRKLMINKEPCRIEVVRGNKLRLIMYNRTSETIYYDKIFQAI